MKRKIFFTYCLLLFFMVNSGIYAQEKLDFSNFKNTLEPHVHKNKWYQYFDISQNEAKQLVSFLFIIYKDFFSSQDVDSCVFTPSCSVYSVETIQENGVIFGIMDAFDRLTRCNPGPKNANIDEDTGKYYDPVQKICK